MKIYEYKIKRQFIREIETETMISPQTVVDFARAVIDFDRDQEQLIVLILDGKNRIKAHFQVSTGTLNASLVHPREVFRPAIISAAAAIILVHNHPSDDPAPSQPDKEITQRVKNAADIIGINLLDHIIITETEYYSMKERGDL